MRLVRHGQDKVKTVHSNNKKWVSIFVCLPIVPSHARTNGWRHSVLGQEDKQAVNMTDAQTSR